MIYFFNNDLELEKVVTSSNILVGNHEHELNNLIRADVVLDLEHALSFIDDVDFFGYYYKDVFYLHKITRQETEHEAEVMVLAGRHIFFEDMLYSEVIKDIRPQNRDAKFMLDQAIGGHTRWNVVITDVTGTLSTNFYWQMPYEALEWIVEHFRLEYLPVILFDGQKINGYELHVKKRLGENKGIRIPWGERVEKLNYEVDYSDIVTQLAPRGKGEEIGEDIYSRRINISDVNFSRNGVVSPVGNLYLEDKNLTAKYGNDGGKPRKGEGEFYDIDDVNELAEAGYQMYLDVSRPQVVISADVVDIGDVTIGDGVNIIRREHDLYFEARVHKISVDLLNPDDAQVELGDYEHFKESKVQKSNKKRIEIIEREVYGQIHQYKIEFDENFNSVVNQWREEQEQALIDVYAEIEASEQRHEDKWENHEAEIDDTIERIVGGSLESLDTNLLDVNSRLLSKLEESDLQPLYGRIDDAFSDISDVSESLNTTRSELQNQLDDAFSDISDVSGDLSSARESLQEQLDKARADLDALDVLEGIEVGGRNWFVKSKVILSNNLLYDDQLDLYYSDGYNRSFSIFRMDSLGLELNQKYILAYEIKSNNPELELRTNTYINGRVSSVDNNSPELIEGEWVKVYTEPFLYHTESTSSVHIYFNQDLESPRDIEIRNIQVNRGTILQDYQEAPEDIEVKITTLSESIEYIDGQLEAKLNRTEIEPIQNKITEYGTTLDANAESIGLLQEKTQLHDDDIEQWSNQAESTAEEVSRILTHNSEQDDLITSVTNESRETAEGLERTINRVSETESDISTAKADIIANADLIGATMTRVDENDQAIGDFQATADGLKADFTRYQSDFGNDMSAIQSQVASYEANVDGFRAEVGVLSKDVSSVESWQREKGAVIDGNADAISARIWKNDIDAIEVGGRNLLLGSKDYKFATGSDSSSFNSISYKDGITRIDIIQERDTTINFYNTGFHNHWNENETIFNNIHLGESYTLSMDIKYSGNHDIEFGFDTRRPSGANYARTPKIKDTNGEWVRVFTTKLEGNRPIQSQSLSIGWFRGADVGDFVEIKNVKLEKGNKATDWTPAPEDIQSDITQLNADITVEAGRINALLTRTSSAEKSIADINSSVDGINADFANYKKDIDSDVGELSSQVASYEASVNGFRAEVGTLQGDIDNVDSWIAQKGSIIDGNADAISARVWNKDIDDLKIGGRNLLRNSNADELSNVASWREWQSDRTRVTVSGKIFVQARTTGSSNFGLQPGYSSSDRFEIVEGRDYIISFEGYTSLTSGDFNYTYLMRADGGNQGSLTPYKVEDAPLPNASNNKRYYFKVNANWSSTEAYLLIGARPRPQWEDTSDAKWVRFRKPQIVEGTKEVPYSQAPENFLQHTDFILESDGFFLGGKYVGGDHYSTAIVGSKDGIDILAQRMRVTGDLLVEGDVKSYALDAVHGDITNLRSKLLTSNVVKSDHLSVGSALANKFNANSAFISRLEVQAANIRDLTGTHIRGGLLDSLNGSTRLNLNTGDWTIGGSATIRFTDTRNAIVFNRGVQYSGAGFDVNNAGRPISYIGTSVDSVNTNNDYWTGLIVTTNTSMWQDGAYSSITGRRLVIRRMRKDDVGFIFDMTGSRSQIRPWGPVTSDAHDLGSSNNYFDRLYAQYVRVNDAQFRIQSVHSTGRGFYFDVQYRAGGASWMHFGGLNSGSYWSNPRYYALGHSNGPFQRAFINRVTESSDARIKQDIIDNDLGLDFINDIKTREYTIIDTKDRKNGVVAQEMLEVLEKHNVLTDAQSIVSMDEMLGVEYTQLIAPTIKAVQDLDVKVETNTERIERLEKENERLYEEIERLKGA